GPRPVAPGAGHAQPRVHRADEPSVAVLVAVESLFACEGDHDGLRPLVPVRVLDVQGPKALGRVLVDMVLGRVREGVDALAAHERAERAIGVVVPELEVPGDW